MSAATVSAARTDKTASQWVVTPAVIDYVLEQCRSFIESESPKEWHRKLAKADTPERLHAVIESMVEAGVFRPNPRIEGDIDTTEAVRQNELAVLTELITNCRRIA